MWQSLVVDQWKSYLHYGEFHIFTDEKSLIHLNEPILHTIWQQKVFTKLLGPWVEKPVENRLIFVKAGETGPV
jgi:hypothetical protein